MLADERAVCRAPSFALLMITLSCETHGGASFGSLKSVKRHGDENCAKVIKLVKAECPKPMSCALCVDDAAVESFTEFCEELIRHAGNKLRRLPNSQHDWFCMTRHLLAHYGLDRPFLESVAHLKQTSFALSQRNACALGKLHFLEAGAIANTVHHQSSPVPNSSVFLAMLMHKLRMLKRKTNRN